jgi:hypothetical protein
VWCWTEFTQHRCGAEQNLHNTGVERNGIYTTQVWCGTEFTRYRCGANRIYTIQVWSGTEFTQYRCGAEQNLHNTGVVLNRIYTIQMWCWTEFTRYRCGAEQNLHNTGVERNGSCENAVLTFADLLRPVERGSFARRICRWLLLGFVDIIDASYVLGPCQQTHRQCH